MGFLMWAIVDEEEWVIGGIGGIGVYVAFAACFLLGFFGRRLSIGTLWELAIEFIVLILCDI